jgi:DNA-directed RNA polymerase delta subunit
MKMRVAQRIDPFAFEAVVKAILKFLQTQECEEINTILIELLIDGNFRHSFITRDQIPLRSLLVKHKILKNIPSIQQQSVRGG